MKVDNRVPRFVFILTLLLVLTSWFARDAVALRPLALEGESLRVGDPSKCCIVASGYSCLLIDPFLCQRQGVFNQDCNATYPNPDGTPNPGGNPVGAQDGCGSPYGSDAECIPGASTENCVLGTQNNVARGLCKLTGSGNTVGCGPNEPPCGNFPDCYRCEFSYSPEGTANAATSFSGCKDGTDRCSAGQPTNLPCD